MIGRMIYCEPCAKKNEWPESWFRSRGPCEMCGKTAICFDVPSNTLPKPKKKIGGRPINTKTKR